MRSVRRARRPLLALVALVVALVVGYSVRAANTHDPAPAGGSTVTASSGSAVALSALPAQVADTVRLIRARGPFPFPRNDGVVFHNYEHVLPSEPDGWYHEYTVPTPGSDDRGGRRLVTGRDGRFYYTADHYESFRRVDVSP